MTDFSAVSAPGEDLASAVLAGVGSFVGEGLDLSGDEPYSFHGRELLVGLFGLSQLYQDFPPFSSPTVSGTVTVGAHSEPRAERG